MVSFELGKEIKKDVFRLVTNVGQRFYKHYAITMESLWLCDRASERGIRRSEVRFLMRIQNVYLCSILVTR